MGASQARNNLAGAVQRLHAAVHHYGTGHATPEQLAETKRRCGERDDEAKIPVVRIEGQDTWVFPEPHPPAQQKK